MATLTEEAVVDGVGVTVINTESGRFTAGLRFASGGGTVINDLGGVIRDGESYPYRPTTAVTGSTGADTLINSGLINGKINLGDGADRFINRDGTFYQVDLGAGDDVVRIEGKNSINLDLVGGAGFDRLELGNTSNAVGGALVTGFEELVISGFGNHSNFSGFSAISLVAVFDQYGFVNSVNLRESANPLATVSVNGAAFQLSYKSTIAAANGSAGRDTVEVGQNAVVSGNVVLGAGDDLFTFYDWDGDHGRVAGIIDGGAGKDTFSLEWAKPGDRSYDLQQAGGFETLLVNAHYVVGETKTAITHASGFTDIMVGQRGSLTIADSAISAANVSVLAGTLTLEAGVTIRRFGFTEAFGFDQYVNEVQGNDLYSTSIVNKGAITGEVRFYIGDDLYDGRTGSVGGIVYGNAGNDTLLGGAGVNRFVGGYGADRLEGGGGNDFLTGGPGNDIFRGTIAELAGDTITDLSVGDRINVSDAAYAGFRYTRSGTDLSFGGAMMAIGSPNVRLATASSTSGGTDLIAVNRFTGLNDFNGDGHSDLLWQNANGSISSWGVSGNAQANQLQQNTYFASVDASWNVVETFDMGGDGRSDILWRNANGALSVWSASGTGFAAGTYNTAVGTDWKIAGTGDINGDGKDDLLWRNDNGSISTWQSTGTSFDQNSYFHASVGTSWNVAGLADFDGDGKDDLLWRNSGGAISQWRSTGTGFAENAYFDASVGNDWHIVGLGDFNGDGRDDMLWRSAGGAVSEWQSTGSGFAKNTYFDTSVANSWQVAQIADFNDDGRADILWHNSSGAISIWQSTGNAFDQNVLYNPGADTSWQIQSHDIF